MRHLHQTVLSFFVLGLVLAGITPATGADKKADPTGTWKWEMTRGDNTRHFTLRIKLDDDKVVGSYATRRGDTENEAKIEDAKLEGDQLSFRVQREFNDRRVTIDMQGKVSQDAITGTGSFSAGDNSREFEWAAKRAVEAADILGTWNMRIETPDGNLLEPGLTFVKKDGKLMGSYTGRTGEHEAKKIEIKNNELSFEVAGENNGNQWKVVYKGKPRGNSIQGTVDYEFGDNSGTIDFEGKRQPVKKEKDDKDDDDDDDDK